MLGFVSRGCWRDARGGRGFSGWFWHVLPPRAFWPSASYRGTEEAGKLRRHPADGLPESSSGTLMGSFLVSIVGCPIDYLLLISQNLWHFCHPLRGLKLYPLQKVREDCSMNNMVFSIMPSLFPWDASNAPYFLQLWWSKRFLDIAKCSFRGQNNSSWELQRTVFHLQWCFLLLVLEITAFLGFLPLYFIAAFLVPLSLPP